MSLSGISSTSLFSAQNQSVENGAKQFQQEFAQLGQDLQSGNLSAAHSDFATLQNLGQQALSLTNTQLTADQKSSPQAQAYTKLSSDLQSGNLSAAQQDYTKVQSDLHYQVRHAGGHHHHSGGGGESSEIQQLGQALQSGNLSSAQSIYSTLQQDFQQVGESSSPSATGTAVSNVSVSA